MQHLGKEKIIINKGNVQEKKKRKRQCSIAHKSKAKQKNKKTNCLCATTHGHFCPLSSLFSSFNFSFHFEEKTFRLAWRENIWALLSIFLPPHPTKHTSKKFFFPFSLKSFSSTLFHLQTNTPYESNQIEEKKHTHTHTKILEPLTI